MDNSLFSNFVVYYVTTLFSDIAVFTSQFEGEC